MKIWLCYTETGSEPNFHGFVRTAKVARKWVLSEVRSDAYSRYNMNVDTPDKIVAISEDGFKNIIVIAINSIS